MMQEQAEGRAAGTPRPGFFALVGGILVRPRATLRALAAGQGHMGHILVLLLLRVVATDTPSLGRALLGWPYLGANGSLALVLRTFSQMVPDLTAILLGGAVLGMIARRRRERAFEVAAYAWVPYLVVQLGGALGHTALQRPPLTGERYVLDAVALGWCGVLWLLGLVELRHGDGAEAAEVSGALPRWAGRGLVAALGLLLVINVVYVVEKSSALAPVGTQGEAPDFRLALHGGGEFHLRDGSASRVTVIDFWASWCRPCLAELPTVDRLWRRYRERGVRMVAVNIEGPEMASAVKTVAERGKLELPIALGGEQVANDYHVDSVPQLFILDPQGRVQQVLLGNHSEDDIVAAIEAALR